MTNEDSLISVTGMHDVDEFVQSQLILSVRFCLNGKTDSTLKLCMLFCKGVEDHDVSTSPWGYIRRQDFQRKRFKLAICTNAIVLQTSHGLQT